MRWQVIGFNLVTGIEQSVVVEAEDEKQAAALAKDKGVLPTSATQLGPASPIEAPPLNYASAPVTDPSDDEAPRIPAYAGLGIMAFLCLVVGALSVVGGLYMYLADDMDEHVQGVCLTMCGLLFCFAAFAGHALRDIARNSWRQ